MVFFYMYIACNSSSSLVTVLRKLMLKGINNLQEDYFSCLCNI